MRHHRARLLHILVIAPVAAIVAGALGLTPDALAAGTKEPLPIVVTVDPGHGGGPTAANPNVPLDPGAIGINGQLEKAVDLDVGMRLAILLRSDLVDVVMTRTTDVYVSTAQRQRISIAHHAALLVSIHAASGSAASGPHADGSLVLYSNAGSAAFAHTLSHALAAQITADGVPDLGVAAGDVAWVHNPVPAATVEMASLSDPTQATLLATAGFRQEVATGIRDGVEAYMPAIIARRNAIVAWRAAHPGRSSDRSLSPASAALQGTSGFQFGPVIAWLVAICAVGFVLLFREGVARVLVMLVAVVARLLGGVMSLRRAAVRRRRRRQRSRVPTSSSMPSSGLTDERTATSPALPAQHGRSFPERKELSGRRADSVYDDIPM